VFGRLTRFNEALTPVTPLPDGSGLTSGTLGPQRTTAWSFASTYQRVFSRTLLNELRIGDTRRSVSRVAAQLDTSASAALGLPGIPATARFPNTLPTFAIAGYQQLGSPPNTATDFGTGVVEIADTLAWVKGRHIVKISMPVAVTQTTNNNAFAGFGTQRPNLVGDPNLLAGGRSVNRWFNTAAFEPAPAFTIGTSSRNPVRGPGYRNLDLALMRRLPLSSARALELRAEIFNVTNTPHFMAPNTVVGSAAFGTITAAGDPRVVQLALKFLF
jgi:hypothetical protein